MRPQHARQHGLGATQRRGRPTSTGMTLVELLVVLAIISVLAAVVMPVFRTARMYAQRAVCISNLHQATLALTLYSQDYDDNLPNFRSDPTSALQPDNLVYWHDHFCRATRLIPNQVTWVSLVLPYVANSGKTSGGTCPIFHCPADTDLVTRPVTSYEFKMELAEQPAVSQLPFPADTAMVWEQWAYHIDSNLSEYDRRSAMNVLFADGHAHWTRLSDTTSAAFGSGPDLHWIFVGSGDAQGYSGNDVLPE
jgi:prepilin-type N-terminal cleavage/methylation domain-containing protein/prepilin-type processing-associated H-X9-DG protein